MAENKMLSVKEAADYLGVALSTMYKYIDDGLVKKEKVLKSTRIPVAQLDKILKKLNHA